MFLQVVTVGLKTVREMCVRCPLVMHKDLLSDLVLYRTERDKHVKNAAKALIAVFRELKPSMLEKKQRGRGADLTLDLPSYGAVSISTRCSTPFCPPLHFEHHVHGAFIESSLASASVARSASCSAVTSS
jgi:hypothetical protein